MLDEKTDATRLCRKVEQNEREKPVEVVSVTKTATSSDLSPQVVVAMRKLPEGVYPACWFPVADLRGLLDERELTHGKFLLNSTNLVLSCHPYNV